MAMPEKKSDVQALLDRLPEPAGGKMPPVEAELMSEVIETLVEGAPERVGDLIGDVREVDNGGDWKARFALNALMVQAGAPGRDGWRRRLAEACFRELAGKHPAAVKTFVLSQLRFIVGPEHVRELVPHLGSDDPQLADAAAAALVSVGKPARRALDGALRGARDRQRKVIENALAQIG